MLLSPTSVASSHYLNVCGARCTVASCVTTGVTPAAPLHSGKSRLSLHLCSCRAARLGSGAPALPVSSLGRSAPGGPSLDFLLSRRESAAPLPAPLHQTGSWSWQLCETPEKREGSRFQGPGPCPWELATALCEPLMTQEVQWGCLQWTDDSRSRQQCRQIVCQRNKNRL